jgi:Subtilase family
MAPIPLSTKRHLIVVTKAGITLPPALKNTEGLSNAFALPSAVDEQVRIRPLFHPRLRRNYGSPSYAVGPSPSIAVERFFHVDAPDDQLESLHRRLLQTPMVEAAFIKPPTYHAALLNTMLPMPAAAPSVTPDFTGRQGYLEAAPGGIDARYAWTVNGGDGTGVSVIDIEGEWQLSHEDLQHNKGGVVAGTPPGSLDWRNHGTSVIGTICADANNFGVTGIAPNVNLRCISIFPESFGSSTAIQQAADLLNPGDIILLEMHRAGPRYNFDDTRQDQAGFIAIEWWPDDLAAIQYATAKGVIVVEAGGNGAENLDDSLYDQNPPSPNGPFPNTWTNPYRRTQVDSGAIIVGAGAPPSGTHNSNWGADRSRLDFSNYGSLMDAQGWGREVTTCGYGDLQGGVTEDTWYTDQFSGTSSASPIVLGALACVQGALKAAGNSLLTPATARSLLRSSGSSQTDGPAGPSSQRIGNRPDIRQMIQLSLGTAVPQAAVSQSVLEAGTLQQNQPQAQARDLKGSSISITFNIYTAGRDAGDK